MTAAAANADTPRFSTDAVPRAIRSLPVAASTHIYQGTLVALNLSGYLVPASADPSLTVVGVANDEADNSSGAAAAINCAVERGAFYLTNSSSTAAVSEADIGRDVFAVDDLTVSRTNVAGTYPVAGRVIGFESSKPIVEVGMLGRTTGGRVDVLYPAGADLSTTGQNLFVKLNGSSQIVLADTAGEQALGVLQNAPANTAIGIVRVFGPSRVWRRDDRRRRARGDRGDHRARQGRRGGHRLGLQRRRFVLDGHGPRRRRVRLAHEHLRESHGGDPHHRGVIAA